MRISVPFGQAELQDMVEAKAEQNCDPSVSSLLHPAEAAAEAPCPSLVAFAVSPCPSPTSLPKNQISPSARPG